MDKKKQNQFIVKISCILASFCLWLYIYNVVSPIKNYKVRNVPVELINVDEIEKSNLALVSDQKFYVTLSLRGTASEVHKATPDKFRVVADMSKYVLKKGEVNIPVKVVQSPKNVNVENSETLFVTIKLDELSEKSVPVKVNMVGEPKDGYYAFDPELDQTQATVSGPLKSTEQVSFVEASGDIQGVDKDTKMTLFLKAFDSDGNVIDGVKINPKSVEVTIPIKKVKTVGIKINTMGNVDENKLKSLTCDPDKLQICGDEDIISKIDSLETEQIDLSEINQSKTIESKVRVPDGVKLINSSGKVSIRVSFGSETQKTFSLKVDIKNSLDRNDVNIEPSNISLTVSGNEDIIKSLKSDDIECFVDVNLLSPGEYSLPVKIVLPNGISKISTDPEEVKVTIIEK